MAIFFYLFSSLIILGSIGVVTSRNPVYAVLWLIFTFLNSSAIFIQLGAEFIALSVIIVYVGAVAVLFLFVVMMLNVNLTEVKSKIFANRAISIAVMFAIIIDLILIIKSSLSKPILITHISNPLPINTTNAHSIGEILYTNYLVVFQLSGLVLLLAMVCCIVLTLRKREGVKKQDRAKQVARDVQESVKLVDVKTKAGIDGINY